MTFPNPPIIVNDPADGDVVRYNATTNEWEAHAPGASLPDSRATLYPVPVSGNADGAEINGVTWDTERVSIVGDDFALRDDNIHLDILTDNILVAVTGTAGINGGSGLTGVQVSLNGLSSPNDTYCGPATGAADISVTVVRRLSIGDAIKLTVYAEGDTWNLENSPTSLQVTRLA